MSRSNGPGAPPNGWPADYRPNDAVDPYQDPYYAQQPARTAPPHPQQAAPPARNARIQQPAPSRVPQNGLPPNLSQAGFPPQGLPPQGLPPQGPPPQGLQPPAQSYGQPPYGNQPPQAAPQGYGQPYTQQPPSRPQPGVPQFAPPPQYTPPAPQAYMPPPAQRTQPPVRTAPPAQGYPADALPAHADPRYSAYPAGYDATPTARPGQPNSGPQSPPVYPPAYAPAPAPLAYVPESTQRPAQPPQQRAQQHPVPPPQSPPAYDKWQIPPQSNQQPHGLPLHQPQIDPHGYDLGNYLPNAAPDPRTQRPTAPPAWPQHAEHDTRHQSNAGPDFAPQFSTDHHAPSQALEPVHDNEYDEHEDDEDYEEAPRKTRYGLIAASLVAAIAMGGGLAYAYKMYVAPRAMVAGAPVIKNSSGPIKIKPAEPGGTKYANTDSKMMEQLAGSTEANADGGPKAVRTMTIERDGSVQNAAPQTAAIQPPSPAVLPATGTVPGMMIEGLSPPPRPAQPAVSAPPATSVQQAARAAPKIIAAAPPAAAFPNEAAAAAVAPAAAAPAAVAVKKAPPKKVAVAGGPTAPPSAVGGPKGTSGFVAVLASVPASGSSRNEAMQQFADLQQKFGGVLGSKSPDVVEAKLPNGVYHRLVVGPPASRDSATGVCSQLKASGYTADCWVTAF